MDNINKNYQLVIIDSPYEVWEEPFVSSLFGKMVRLKKLGYESHYSKDVLPVDTTDFIATHVLLCRKLSDQSLEPIMGYKTTTLEKCRQYNLNFPGLSLVQNAKMPAHIQAVEEIIEHCDRSQKALAYLGSWTVDPHYKTLPLSAQLNLKEAFIAIYSMLYRAQNVSEVIIGGTLRFKTEKIFKQLGHLPLMLGEKVLPEIKVVHLAKEPVIVMHASKLPHPHLQNEIQWRGLWKNRLHIQTITIAEVKAA